MQKGKLVFFVFIAIMAILTINPNPALAQCDRNARDKLMKTGSIVDKWLGDKEDDCPWKRRFLTRLRGTVAAEGCRLTDLGIDLSADPCLSGGSGGSSSSTPGTTESLAIIDGLVGKTRTARSNCQVDANSVRDAKSDARDEFSALGISTDGLDALDGAVGSVERVPVRCIREADETIAKLQDLRRKIEDLDTDVCDDCLAKGDYGRVGSETLSAHFTSNGKPLLPRYMKLYFFLTYEGFDGSSTDVHRGIGAEVSHEGWSGGGGVGLNLELVLHRTTALFAGVRFDIFHRETLFHHEYKDGYKTHVDVVVTGSGIVGVELFGWVNMYFRFYGQPSFDGFSFDGWGALGGLGFTGLDCWFFAVEGGYHFNLNQAETLEPTANPADSEGPKIVIVTGFNF